MKPSAIIALGAAATMAMTAVWHGPLGAGDRLAGRIETSARSTLDAYEMTAVEARLDRSPLSRRLLLSGPADSFQRGEIVRLLDRLPGVGEARWAAPAAAATIPVAIEAALMALAGFAFGLLIAYLVELRRRSHRWDRI